MKQLVTLLFLLGLSAIALKVFLFRVEAPLHFYPTAQVLKQDLKVEIKAVGELEAARSTSVVSSIKGDQGKMIELIADGTYVQTGQILAKLDPTPFEEKIEKLNAQIKEQEAYLVTLEKTLEWDKVQAAHKERMATFEVETAQLELDKIVHGDGPQEMSRLKAAMQKAWLKFEELQAYSHDLIELEAKGFLNTAEVKQAQKKLSEEQEAYEMAKQQYESYVQHVYPMQVKKAETHLKRAQVAQEETAKSGFYTIAKSLALLDQAQEGLHDYLLQLKEAQKELDQTEIRAPAPGMVVHREEYRAGQRRKPRVGDHVVKNQPLIDLPDLSAMVMKTRVREVDLFKIDIGKKATIEVDAYPHLNFNGTITSIGVLATSDGGRVHDEKYFEVHLALEESDPRLRPGMTARAIIHAQEAKNALVIPLHAVFDDGRQFYCYIIDHEQKAHKRNIQLGISNEQLVEIKEGLQEGLQICLLHPQQDQ